jgi:prepilin-type N-terminal cleavage/methylation domain-containing protein
MALNLGQKLKGKQGFTLMELLTVVGILAILALAIFLVLDPLTQIQKAYDSRRKADLRKLQTALEDYYNDHNAYPADLNDLAPDYLTDVPTDPSTKAAYDYYPAGGGKSYRIYVELGNDQDPSIAEVGCDSGCGPGGGTAGGSCAYNYGVTSADADLESCEACHYGCQGAVCNDLIKDVWDCPRWFCTGSCEDKCADPAYHCTLK